MVGEREKDARGRKFSGRRRYSAESPGKIVGIGRPLLALGRPGARRARADQGGWDRGRVEGKKTWRTLFFLIEM